MAVHVAYYFMQSAEELDALASLVKQAMNLADTNPVAHSREQKRYGLNFEGHYYLLMGVGLELYVLRNTGINEENAPFACRHYLLLKPALQLDVEEFSFRGTCTYLAAALQEKGIEGALRFYTD